jgi:hypothetical protein
VYQQEQAAVRTRLVLRPGQPGTKKLVAQYGPRLICVRYKYDPETQKRYKTIELIVSESDWTPRTPPPDKVVFVRVVWGEPELARTVKAAGGRWNTARRLWELRYDKVVELRLEQRIVQDPG